MSDLSLKGKIVTANRNAKNGGNELKAGQQYEVRQSTIFDDNLYLLVDGDGTNFVYWPAVFFD